MMTDIISCLWPVGMVWALINDINKVHVSGDGFTRPGDYIYELLNQVLVLAQQGRHSVGSDPGVGAGGHQRGHVSSPHEPLRQRSC